MADAFCDFLAFVDFGHFSLEKLVAALAEVEDVGVGFAPCWEAVSVYGLVKLGCGGAVLDREGVVEYCTYMLQSRGPSVISERRSCTW